MPVVSSGAGSLMFGPRWSGMSEPTVEEIAKVSLSDTADGPRYVRLHGVPLEPLQQPHRNIKLRFRSVPNWLLPFGGHVVQPFVLLAFLRWVRGVLAPFSVIWCPSGLDIGTIHRSW